MKLGKRPAAPRPHDLKLAAYAPKLPTPPALFGHERSVVTRWGMLGNDQYGDCVFAGAAHETALWTAEAGRPASFDDKHVLADYGAVTGFTPNDPNSDQGTDVHQALAYRRATGIADAHGKRHKLGAYMTLRPGDWTQLCEAAYLFSAVGIGIEFPDYAMGQFDAGLPWNVKSGGHIEGGHYIPVVGRPARGFVDVVTWGRVQRMSEGFYVKYCDEAYALLSPEMLSGGRSLEGFNLRQLQADLKTVSA
jgi:hypothetical protein